MTEESIKRKISTYEDDIDEYCADKRIIQAKIADLEALKNKYTAYQREFETCQTNRNTKLEGLHTIPRSTRITESLYNGMSDLLSGNKYQSAYCEIDGARATITVRIEQLANEIETYDDLIASRRNSIYSLQKELRNLDK